MQCRVRYEQYYFKEFVTNQTSRLLGCLSVPQRQDVPVWTNQEICEKHVCSPPATLKRDIPMYLSNGSLNKLLFAKQEAQGHITHLRTFFTIYKPLFIPAYWIKKKSIVLSQLPPLLGSVIRDSSDFYLCFYDLLLTDFCYFNITYS